MGANDNNGWCILRTSGPRTLALAESLAEAGIEAWTPKEMISKRLRRVGQQTDIGMPILPTFVFVRAHQIVEVARNRSLTPNRHPPFSLFRHGGRFPIIREASMVSLRRIEEKKAQSWEALQAHRARQGLKREPRHLSAQQKVRVEDSAWAGMIGIVTESDGRNAVIDFGGSFNVTVNAWLLSLDDIESAVQPAMGTAA